MTSIAIVTPWLGHPELAGDYVAAVEPELRDGDEVLIVDNGGAPDLPFEMLSAVVNLGFSGGSNLGLRHATADAVLFLNNDVAARQAGWLDMIRRAVKPGVLAGPVRDSAHANVDGHRLPYIDGWCLAGMRADLENLGGFPLVEEPAYYSDNILCLEARAAGMTLRDVRVPLVHKESYTSKPRENPDVGRVTLANRELYARRVRELLHS